MSESSAAIWFDLIWYWRELESLAKKAPTNNSTYDIATRPSKISSVLNFHAVRHHRAEWLVKRDWIIVTYPLIPYYRNCCVPFHKLVHEMSLRSYNHLVKLEHRTIGALVAMVVFLWKFLTLQMLFEKLCALDGDLYSKRKYDSSRA